MKLLIIILVTLVAASVPLLYLMFNGMSAVKRLVVRDVDLSKVADGTYTGAYHRGRWTYDIEVVVRNHRIQSIKNTNTKMDAVGDFNAQAEAEIVRQQRVAIDVVSGATLNTKAFSKAVENALAEAAPPLTAARSD
jgi:uncharacterized protein with FMN-binding domain